MNNLNLKGQVVKASIELCDGTTTVIANCEVLADNGETLYLQRILTGVKLTRKRDDCTHMPEVTVADIQESIRKREAMRKAHHDDAPQT